MHEAPIRKAEPQPPPDDGNSNGISTSPAERLGHLRAEIDGIDDAIVALLAERFGVVKEVASIKQAQHLPVVAPARHAEVLRRVAEAAASLGVDEEFVRRLYEAIHTEACRIEDKIMDSDAPQPPPAEKP
jgi:chorismate mutase-like protein